MNPNPREKKVSQSSVSIKDLKELLLQTRVESGRHPKKSIFWGNPRIETNTGEIIYLTNIGHRLSFDNIVQTKEEKKDYYGGPVRIRGKKYDNPLAANPQDLNKLGRIKIDLSELDGVRFKASIGSDYPLGHEQHNLHHTFAVRTEGKKTRYLTVIEPYESDEKVKSVEALSPDYIRVELVDGRIQEIKFENFEEGNNISVKIEEKKNGEILAREITSKYAK